VSLRLATLVRAMAAGLPRNVTGGAPSDAPGWFLIDSRFDPEALTTYPWGRGVVGLHELLWQGGPSDRGGADLFPQTCDLDVRQRAAYMGSRLGIVGFGQRGVPRLRAV
jgi:hypothetical protein